MSFYIILQFNTKKGIVCMRGSSFLDPTELAPQGQADFLKHGREILHIPADQIEPGDTAGMISVFKSEEVCTRAYAKLLENKNAKPGTFPEYRPS